MISFRKCGSLLMFIAVSAVILAFNPRATRKFLSNTRGSLSIPINLIVNGDTVVFEKDKNAGKIFFMPNGTLQEYHWLNRCGNVTRKERRMIRRKEWKGIGHWDVLDANNKTTLKLDLYNKDIVLERISQGKDYIIFYARSVQTEQ